MTLAQAQAPLPPGLDPNYVFNQLVPLVAVIAVIISGSLGLRWMFRSPIGEAIAQRIREGRRHGKHDDASRAALEDRVAQLQEQVTELGERVEFAERLLTEQQRSRQVGPR
jgi:uncharacterized protein YlxW (UPF0749 family)